MTHEGDGDDTVMVVALLLVVMFFEGPWGVGFVVDIPAASFSGQEWEWGWVSCIGRAWPDTYLWPPQLEQGWRHCSIVVVVTMWHGVSYGVVSGSFAARGFSVHGLQEQQQGGQALCT
ncbi:hypothetical protein BYT27DRAFT_7207007 [Phlegmacium glaucopus]|nr:hypothetical protein BYT27DRAFT_7207007 [Phlegmacium glaucopus]